MRMWSSSVLLVNLTSRRRLLRSRRSFIEGRYDFDGVSYVVLQMLIYLGSRGLETIERATVAIFMSFCAVTAQRKLLRSVLLTKTVDLEVIFPILSCS